MTNLAATTGIEVDRLVKLNGLTWKTTPTYARGGAIGGPAPHLLISPPLRLEVGNGNYAKFRPGFAGTIRAVIARVKEDGAGAAANTVITPRINGVALTGGAVTLALASAVSGRLVAGTVVTALNTFDANDAIDINQADTVAYTNGEVEVYLVIEPKA